MNSPALFTAARCGAAAFAIVLLTGEAAWADCSPAAANNVVATCTGTTNNQGAGAPGTSADTSGYGIGTETGVTVTVDSNATVTGTNQAINIADGTIINGAGATITGGWGMRAATGSINLTNSGIVAGTSPSTSYGMYVYTDATVTNNAGASITGGSAGIRASHGSIYLINSGSVIATSNTFGAVYANTNATVTNNAGASITSRGTTIRGILGFVDVINSGSITGTGNQSSAIKAGTYATVTNNAGGSITGTWYGINAAAGGSSVFNAGSISGGTAAILFSGTGNTLTLAPGSVITGNVLGTGSDTFQLGGTGAATFDVSQIDAAGQYQGFGTFNKIDSSIWTLTGTSTFAGPVNVNGGTLNVDGDISSASGVTVNAGGTLGGTGIVGNTTVIGGTFAPGSGTAGTSMTVNGTLGFDAASTYAVNVSPSAASSANVSGTATLGGATVNAIFVPGSYISKRYTILTAAGFGGSTFGAITNTGAPAAISTALSYDLTHVYLDLTLNFSTPAANTLNGNQNNAANAIIGYFNSTGGVPAAFASLDANGLAQVSGQPGASTAQAGFAASGQFVNAIFDGAFDDNSGQGGVSGFADENAYAAKPKQSRAAKDAYAAVTPRDRIEKSFGARWNVWAAVYGGNSRVSGDTGAGTNTTTSRVFGAVIGAGYRPSADLQLGFALGGAGSNFGLDGGFGGGKADIFNAAVYAKRNWGSAYVSSVLSYAWQDTSTDRTVTVAGTDTLHASFKAQALAARLESGWRYATPSVGITPYAALQTTAFFLPSYGETATSGSSTFALNYASKTITATRGELGAKFDRAVLVRDGVFTLKAKTAWAHDWNTDRSATATFQALPGATFTTNGAQPSANAALVSLGGDMGWHNGWSVAANADGEFSRTTAAYAGKGSVRYVW
jgi:uncharacterized protein with beta-barrel porin domain